MATPIRHMNAGLPAPFQTILQRIAGSDKSAIKECLNAYGDFVWRLVRKNSQSDMAAEAMVQDVFKDIWQYAACYDSAKLSENDFISMLIRQRLRKRHIH